MDRSIIVSNALHFVVSLTVLVTQSMSTISPDCRCIEFDDGYMRHRDHGIFTSPNYPNSYKKNVTSNLLKHLEASHLQNGYDNSVEDSPDCLVYSFTGKLDQIVQLSFDSLDLARSSPRSDCSSGDFVKLYLQNDEGSSVTSPATTATWNGVILCGKIDLDSHNVYYSSSSHLLLQFSYSPLLHPHHQQQQQQQQQQHHHQASSASGPVSASSSSGFSGWYKFVNRSTFLSDGDQLSGTLCDYEFLSITSASKANKAKSTGKFYSPKYPSPYARGIKCAYHFMAKYNERVKVTFEKIDLANDDLSCLDSLDHITVHDGRSSASPIIAQLCNNNRFVTIISTGPDLYIEFTTGMHGGPSKIPSSSMFSQSSSSSSSLLLSSSRGNSHSSSVSSSSVSSFKSQLTNSPLPSWSMQISPGYHLGEGFAAQFHFYVSNDPPARNVTSDQIRKSNKSNRTSLRNGADQFAPPAPAAPSLDKQVSKSSSPDSIFNQYHKDGTCEFSFSSDTSKNGTFSSPNYPSGYGEDVHCTYYFTSSGKERIQIAFVDFDLYTSPEYRMIRDCEESDSVMILVVINGNKERIDKFCSKHPPVQMMSNGPVMIVHFRSHSGPPSLPLPPPSSSLTGQLESSADVIVRQGHRGFTATYRFITDFGITGGVQDPKRGVCAFVFNSSSNSNGSFASPNWPGLYPRDTECHYFFYGAANERLHIQFAYFDVEGVPPCTSDSASDYVEFSNFQTVDRKMPRSCGVKKPSKISSDGEFFRITFKSNDKFDGTGFEAFYQFRNSTIEDNSNAHRMSNGASESSCALKYFLLFPLTFLSLAT